MLTLWGRTSSANVQKVAWLIAELGLEVDRKDVGGPFGGLDSPEYGAMNPNRLIPTLQDGDTAVWESEAVLRYLGSQYGAVYFPEDPKQRAAIDQWMCWNQSTWFPAISQPFLMIMKTPVTERDPRQMSQMMETLNTRLALVEAQLETRKFLAGDHLTLADFSFSTWLYRYFTLEIERPEFKKLQDYYAGLCARPAYVEHVQVSYEFMRVPGAERP